MKAALLHGVVRAQWQDNDIWRVDLHPENKQGHQSE
jgi:hypothetical protein